MKLEGLVAGRMDALAGRIAALEKRTSAELVMVLRPSAGSYGDRLLWAALAVSLVALGAVMYSPWEVHYDAVLPIVVAAGAAVSGALWAWPTALRWLAGETRLEKQTKESAEAAFTRHDVWATRERTGILVYYCHFERRLQLLPDIGLKATIPGGELNAIAHTFHSRALVSDPIEALGLAVDELAGLLEKAFPRRGDDVDERSDRPVIEE